MGKGNDIAAGPNQFTGLERRKFPRMQVYRDILLYNQNSFAEILNISCGGLACKGHVMPENIENDFELELLNCESGHNVRGIRCRRVRAESGRSTSGEDGAAEDVWCYEFSELNSRKIAELVRFIDGCFIGSRPEVIFS